jgi:cytosine/uracil/thiamine/allantoin permease
MLLFTVQTNIMNMKKYLPLSLVVLLMTTLTSCSAIEGIFKAGVWSGVILVVIVLALIIWVISKIFGGRG